MKYYKDLKALLFTIEGFDRTGKRTLLTNLLNHFKNDENVYIYITPDDPNKPDFKTNKQEYLKFLENSTKKLMEDILKLSNEYDIIIKKDLLLSDMVFSELFNRLPTVLPYMEELRRKFTVINLVMLFNTYPDYVKRIERIKQLLKYNILEYKLIHNKFKAYSKKCFNLFGDLYHIHNLKYFASPKSICNDISIYINSMRNTLFNRFIQ